jgi:hypothetical protein
LIDMVILYVLNPHSDLTEQLNMGSKIIKFNKYIQALIYNRF